MKICFKIKIAVERISVTILKSTVSIKIRIINYENLAFFISFIHLNALLHFFKQKLI